MIILLDQNLDATKKECTMKSFILAVGLTLGLSSICFAHNYPNPISPQEAKALTDSGAAVLIDVREQNEVSQGMAEPALWYPKSSIDAALDKFVAYLSQYPNEKIIIYCRSGHRASVVIQALAGAGVVAWNMGGFQDWLNAGLPVKTAPPLE